MSLTHTSNPKLSEYELPLLEFLSNTLLGVFKNRLPNQPFTLDRVKYLLLPFISTAFLPLEINLELFTNDYCAVTSSCEKDPRCLESWNLSIQPISKSDRVGISSTSPTQLKLLYQSIYTKVKRTPLSLEELSHLDFRISTPPYLPQPSIYHSFDTVIIKRRFKIRLCCYHYPEEVQATKASEPVPVSALSQALRSSTYPPLKIKPKKVHPHTSPYASLYVPHTPVPGSPVPQAMTLSSSHEDRRLVGSYEESLFRGRMSSLTSHSVEGFQVQLGVLGAPQCRPKHLSCPPHRACPFPVQYYDHPPEERGSSSPSSPYVGTLMLFDPFAIPDRGQLQFTIQNPQRTCVKVLLIPYDFSSMPTNTKTFLRHKSYRYADDTKVNLSSKGRLESGAHFHVCHRGNSEYWVYGIVRLIFNPRAADEGGDRLCKTVDHPPDQLKYAPVSETEWEDMGIISAFCL